MNAKQQAMVDAVKAHALAHYNDNAGWDTVVECFEDKDILEDMGTAKTNAQAIANVADVCDILHERRCEVQVMSGERECYPDAFAYFEDKRAAKAVQGDLFD